MWDDKPMPDGERQLLTALSGGVWLIALAMNVSHVYDHLGQYDIAIDDTRRMVLCLAPDVLLLIGVWKLRYRARSSVAWAMVGTGLSWLAWSALSTAKASPSAWLLAVGPIVVAVLTTLALEFKHAEAPAPVEPPAPPVRGDDKPQPPAFPDERPEPAPRVPAKTTAKGAPKPAPSRQEARAILLDLDDVDDLSNAELARRHGGTDTYWRGRKADVRAELADMTREAGAL